MSENYSLRPLEDFRIETKALLPSDFNDILNNNAEINNDKAEEIFSLFEILLSNIQSSTQVIHSELAYLQTIEKEDFPLTTSHEVVNNNNNNNNNNTNKKKEKNNKKRMRETIEKPQVSLTNVNLWVELEPYCSPLTLANLSFLEPTSNSIINNNNNNNIENNDNNYNNFRNGVLASLYENNLYSKLPKVEISLMDRIQSELHKMDMFPKNSFSEYAEEKQIEEKLSKQIRLNNLIREKLFPKVVEEITNSYRDRNESRESSVIIHLLNKVLFNF